ncbi:MAG: xanthine dehydrogenase family protein molybdopterin-binding subunit [Nocardiopsaceae bacterium]|nr:xanthine dehydrogenase family protein molybdopterin-binding subunit [Nocardiopsaceae bacterium]
MPGHGRHLDRRRFLGYLVAAPTLAVAVGLGADAASARPAKAAVPSPPQPEEIFDLGDMQDLAASPTSGLITVHVNEDGTAAFAVPRAEVGQGMTTAIAMMVAEELDLPLGKVSITLADARPELMMNQLTGGSNSMRSMYVPVRTAAAIARERLAETAAAKWGTTADRVTTRNGVVTGPQGQTATYGELAAAAAATATTRAPAPRLKAAGEFTILGTPQGRIDAYDAITGRKQYTMDLKVPDAKPTMVARPPTIGGTPASLDNEDEIRSLPGVTDVAVITSGIAIRAEAFGQCIDAIQKVRATWNPGPVAGASDDAVQQRLKAALPDLTTPVSLLADTVEADFFFAFASNSPLEPDCAIADVRDASAEIWSPLKAPIVAQGEIAQALGLPQDAVTVHVTEGGGSFGRHLFHDAALEAAEISQKMGKPVKLSWSRTDSFRQGRAHPMCVSRIRASYRLGNVLTYEQRHTSVQTEFGHGLGDMVTATASKLPVGGGLTLSQTIFELTQSSPYDFGVTVQALNEVPLEFSTGSMRNIYSPNVVCAQELVVDQLAKKMGKDPLAFRRGFLKDKRLLAALNKAAEAGDWGKALPEHMAQGIAVHSEYQASIAVLAEIDCTPRTVNRHVPDAVTGPRVTRVTVVVDPGFAINPRGLEAQMIGGVEDGIAMALTSSLHISRGLPLEGSWDNYFYTREWNTPLDIQVIILPNTGDSPSGAGELAVAPTMAATACAYARATGRLPTRFPVNHDDPLGFTPLPAEPSTPQSPTDGLDHVF